MTGYTWVMEREVNGEVVREQAKAWSIDGIRSVIRAYEMANLGWRIADLRYNDHVKKVLKESKGGGIDPDDHQRNENSSRNDAAATFRRTPDSEA